MKYRVVSTSPSFGEFVFEPVEYLRENGCEVLLKPEFKTEDDLVAGLANVDALIVGLEPVTAKVMTAAKKLKAVAKHGAGVDNIDIPAATEAGLMVISAPGANSEAVAELTLGLFLSLARSIPLANRQIQDGGWPRIVGLELADKTLGIVGFGQIGRKVAARASGFNMKVLAHDDYVDPSSVKETGAEMTSLQRVLEEADYLGLHVPLTPETRGLIGEKELKTMKETAVLVNVARGGIVDEAALLKALKDKSIRGAALDVFEKEPAGPNPLLEMENFIATPHMAGYTREALVETGMICCRGLVAALEGRKPENIVNPDVYSS